VFERRVAFVMVLCAVAVTCLPLVDIGHGQGTLDLVDEDSRLLSPGAPSADASLGSQESKKPPISTKKVHGGIKLEIKVPKIKGLPKASQYKTLGNAAHPYGEDKGEERIEKELKVAENVHKSSKFMKHAMAHGAQLQTVSAKWPAGKPKFIQRHKSKPTLRSSAAQKSNAAWPLGGLNFNQPDSKFHDPVNQEQDTPDLGEGEDVSERPHISEPKHAQKASSHHDDEGEDNNSQDIGQHQHSDRTDEERDNQRHDETESRRDDSHSQSDEELGEQRSEDHGINSRSASEDGTSNEAGLQDMLRANGLQTVPSAHWVDAPHTQSNKPVQEQKDSDEKELGESAAQDEDSDATELGEAAEQEEGGDTAQTRPQKLNHAEHRQAPVTQMSRKGHSERDLGESATISPRRHREETQTHGANQQQDVSMKNVFGNDNDGADMP